jgi:archaetidylinositol phosphate synthase
MTNSNLQTKKEYKEEKRVDNSLLFTLERKFNIPEKIFRLIPPFITPRFLMTIGFVSAIFAGISFYLTTFSKYWLIASSFFLLLYLFCDRYDGRLARLRGITSYRGFYADHMLDTLALLIIFLGLGFSPGLKLIIALGIVILYYIIAINILLMTYIRGIFNVTFFRLSPAEGILILVGLCIVSLFFSYPLILFKINFTFLKELTLLDLAGIGTLLFFLYIAIFTIIKNFIYVEQFEKKYPIETIWEYLKKVEFIKKNPHLDKILNNLSPKEK